MSDVNTNTSSTTQSFKKMGDFLAGQTGSIISATGDIIDFPPIGDKPPASSRSASAKLLMIFSPEI